MKSDGRRVARVEKEVQLAIAQYLISGFRTPLPGIITVSHVKMPADLRSARVFISLLGDSSDLEGTVRLLQERAFEIQAHIGKNLQMRYCPKLSFEADKTTAQVLKVEKILSEIAGQRKGQPEAQAVGADSETTDTDVESSPDVDSEVKPQIKR